MSHLDVLAEFSVAQVLADGATSTNVMKLKGDGLAPNAVTNIGSPGQMYLVVQLAATGVGTITANLLSSDNEDLSDGTTHLSITKDVTGLAAGEYAFAVVLPFGDYKSYLGLTYTGKETVNSYLTLEPRLYRVFSDGLTDPVTGRP
jgi:hypothetical protein